MNSALAELQEMKLAMPLLSSSWAEEMVSLIQAKFDPLGEHR